MNICNQRFGRITRMFIEYINTNTYTQANIYTQRVERNKEA